MSRSYTARDVARWARRGTTAQRGLGRGHQARRKQLLAELVDGTPCLERAGGPGAPVCGQPMWHPTRCPFPPDRRADGRCGACRLDLCHGVARALGGHGQDSRLGHAYCNRAAGPRLAATLARARRPQPPTW
jgi:hypothetical protein